ncbi:cytochrome-c peroxidase [Aridibaculum aurantiacum]|uniref:cytochrome-c peroxidase n=1 Tax=Aridibaculum aurantiacum TaxID=2810307 RepID=UPI001A97A9C9|nr:cytochrome c peroxidase [Aridibaculum aurantiacum]
MKRAISILFFAFVAAGFFAIEACKKTDATPAATPMVFKTPAGWPEPAYNFGANPITNQGFELGRKLFYDGRLSKDGNFPCASCHQQFAAFATFDHNFSHGFDNTFTTRNAHGLYNLAWRNNFMYDGGIVHLDLQPLAPITATNEMAETIENVLNKLRADGTYRSMFKAAFGDETINTERMTKALSQFMLMMVSSNSRYDKMKRGEYTFNLAEGLGYDIFKAKCVSCHKEPFFTDFNFRNTGLPVDPTINDYGRMIITRNPADSLKFQVPSLRNVQLTFPYGHDGRFITLDHVMDHYRNGVVNGPTTDPLVKNKIPLSNFEIGQLKAFLYTLTDSTFIADPRFKQP